jgi:hypothetical protein
MAAPFRIGDEVQPGERVVDVEQDPKTGGWYVLTSLGGVHAYSDAPGGGVPIFEGSYLGLPPESRRGTRSFVDLQLLPGGGYRLVSNQPGEIYQFSAGAGLGGGLVYTPPPEDETGAPPPGQPAPAPTYDSAEAAVRGILEPIGLGALVIEALGVFNRAGGGAVGSFAVEQWMPTTAEFKAQYPEFDVLKQQGRAMTPGQILQFREGVREIFNRRGIPAGFYDEAMDYAEFLIGDVSLNELADRTEMAERAVYFAPAEVKDALFDQYGVTAGDLTAFFLDPDRAEVPILRKQLQAAEIGGAARRADFGALSTTEAERLAAVGVTSQEAQAGFGQLAGSRELFGVLPGEAGTDITREEQLGATFEGSAGAQERIRRRQRRRQAAFEAGGGFAAGQGGVSGLGGEG